MMSNKRIKLLIVEPVSDLGGVSQFILSLVRHLPRDTFEIHVAASGAGPLFELLKRNNILIHSLKIDYSIFSCVFAVFSFRIFLKKEQFDLIHAHTPKSGLLCTLSRIRIPSRIVYTGHCLRFLQKRNAVLKIIFFYIERFICKSSAFITLVGESERTLGISMGLFESSASRVVPISINVDRFSGVLPEDAEKQRKRFAIPLNAFVIGMVGRLTAPRDPETFVKAAAILNARMENVYFLWVGEGDLEKKTIREAARLGIIEKIIITGWQNLEDIPKLLSAMDALLHTTKIESMGISILEAMAAKKPIVASNVGGIPDRIRDGVTGWLFEVGDYEKAALLVESIYKNNHEAEEIAKNAFNLVVDEYSPEEKMAKEFQDIYEKALS